MGMVEGLRNATDVVLLGRAAGRSKEYHSSLEARYDELALNLTDQVEDGSRDPVVAEAALADLSNSPREEYVWTESGAKDAVRLERLVLKGVIDPFFADNILDRDFSTWAITDALNHSPIIKK